MAGVFTAENAEVEIYKDTGEGAPDGDMLFMVRFKRAVGLSIDSSAEILQHAGHVDPDILTNTPQYTLTLTKNIEQASRDLRVSNALYYILVKVRTDDMTIREQYVCKKCRRTSWNLDNGDTGLSNARATFLCSSISPTTQ